jgi:hypothetical protein
LHQRGNGGLVNYHRCRRSAFRSVSAVLLMKLLYCFIYGIGRSVHIAPANARLAAGRRCYTAALPSTFQTP